MPVVPDVVWQSVDIGDGLVHRVLSRHGGVDGVWFYALGCRQGVTLAGDPYVPDDTLVTCVGCFARGFAR